jgi:hypothetical protein
MYRHEIILPAFLEPFKVLLRTEEDSRRYNERFWEPYIFSLLSPFRLFKSLPTLLLKYEQGRLFVKAGCLPGQIRKSNQSFNY